MSRKLFWQGFATGSILLVTTLVVVYFKFLKIPDLALDEVKIEDLNGEIAELNPYKGKPLVVNYWATWCMPCIKEFPYFEEVKKEYGDKVNFVMISDESINKIKKFSISKKYLFDYLKSTEKLRSYSINAIPITYFYNPKGELITKYSGDLNKEKLISLIEMSK